MQFGGLISRAYMFFGTRNPNLKSILKSEVDVMVFLRMRSNTSNFQCILCLCAFKKTFEKETSDIMTS